MSSTATAGTKRSAKIKGARVHVAAINLGHVHIGGPIFSMPWQIAAWINRQRYNDNSQYVRHYFHFHEGINKIHAIRCQYYFFW